MRGLLKDIFIGLANGALWLSDGFKAAAKRMVANDLNRRQDRQ